MNLPLTHNPLFYYELAFVLKLKQLYPLLKTSIMALSFSS